MTAYYWWYKVNLIPTFVVACPYFHVSKIKKTISIIKLAYQLLVYQILFNSVSAFYSAFQVIHTSFQLKPQNRFFASSFHLFSAEFKNFLQAFFITCSAFSPGLKLPRLPGRGTSSIGGSTVTETGCYRQTVSIPNLSPMLAFSVCVNQLQARAVNSRKGN